MCEARKIAFANGDKRYEGSICSKCGTTEKYTKLQECVECTRSNHKNWYYFDHEKTKRQMRMHARRPTKDVYENFLNAQNNVCAICSLPETYRSRSGDTKSLALDHCHETGRFRGLLCQRCNVVLGYVKDDPSILKKMMGYLS